MDNSKNVYIYIYIYLVIILVGGIPTPLKNISQMVIICPNIWKVIKVMLQTTNQLCNNHNRFRS